VKRKERVEDKVEKSSSQPRLLEALKQMFAFSPGNRQLLIFVAIKKKYFPLSGGYKKRLDAYKVQCTTCSKPWFIGLG
jgi:hypothetical protein